MSQIWQTNILLNHGLHQQYADNYPVMQKSKVIMRFLLGIQCLCI